MARNERRQRYRVRNGGIRGSSTSFTVLGRSVRDTTTDGEKEDIMRPIIGIGALGAVVGVGIGLILGGIAAGVVVGILGLASGAYYGKTRGRSNPTRRNLSAS